MMMRRFMSSVRASSHAPKHIYSIAIASGLKFRLDGITSQTCSDEAEAAYLSKLC